MNRLIKVLGAVVVIVAIAGIGFYAGTKGISNNPQQQLNDVNATGSNTENQMMKGAGPGKLSPENMIQGQVTEINNQEITVELTDGTTKTILLSGTTRIGKVITGTLDDIVVGSSLAVNGAQNSDGSVSAQMVQIRQQAPQQKPPKRQGQ